MTNLDELKRLEAAATPAPWERDETHLVHGRGFWPDGTPRTLRETPGLAKFVDEADAVFCETMRNALPAMISEIEELRKRVHGG